MTHKIYPQKNGAANETDRLALASLLIKMGYTVRIGKEKKENKNQNIVFVEYWEE